MGEVSVERLSIESAPGRSVELLVYSPRTAKHVETMPVMLTIHGLTGSKEGMYSFNIELARRNFTVVSIDLPGHGDSILPFNITDFHTMAQDAYAAVRYIQTTYPDADNESYGVLSHSLGFRVALELKDFPIAPMAYVAVGDVGKLTQDEYIDFPENLLFAIGSFDEIISRQDALQAIRTATGNSSAVDGITYGSLDSHTAHRLVFSPSNHVFEVVDSKLVSEATSWLIQGVQGEAQIEQTRDPKDQVYFSKNIATFAGSIFILISVIPVMWLVYSYLPEKLKPRKVSIDAEPYDIKTTFEIGSAIGVLAVIIFVGMALVGLSLEDAGISFLSSLSSTGIVLFLILSAIGTIILIFVLTGRNRTRKALASVGLVFAKIREQMGDIGKNLIIAGVGICWLLLWLGLAGLPESKQPEILLILIKLPVGTKAINTIILTVIAIPLFLVEAALIRGILLNPRVWSGKFHGAKRMLLSVGSKFAIVAILTVIIIFGTASAGVVSGRVVLIGVIWVRIIIVQLLSFVISVWTSLKFENTWSAVILSAFVLSLVLVTTIPIT